MSDKLKFGILGFGLFAEKYLVKGFDSSQLAEIHSITKQNGEDAKQRADFFGIPNSYSYDQKDAFLADPELDAVYVAGPNNLHMQDTIDCLRAGKYVIVEKPMAMNAHECETMISEANESGKLLMVAQCYRYNSTVKYIKSVADAGTLGDLVSGTCDFMSDGTKSQRRWKYDKTLSGGGAAFDLGVHLIDSLRFISNQEIIKTSCIHHPTTNPDEVDIIASFLMEFDKGFVGRSTSSYIGSRNTFIEIFGTQGYIRAYDWNMPGSEIRIEMQLEGCPMITTMIKNEDQYTAQIDDFANAILNGLPSPVSGEEGLKNQRIIDLINE